MNLKYFRKASFLAIAIAVASGAAFASTPQGTFDKTFSVSGPVDLEVETHSGDVIVHGGPSGTVSIHGKIYVGDHWLVGNRHTDVGEVERNPPVRQQGNSIRIDPVSERDISVTYEITVPAETKLRTRSGSGDITVEGIRGDADLQSGSGDIKLSQIKGNIHLQTGSGNVRAHEIEGAVRGGTGSGDIEMEENGSGDIDLHAGSGNITARGVHGGLRLEAGSGDITAEGSQTGGWEIHTGSGNVHVRLPSDAAFDADFATSSGSMDVTPAITTTVQGHMGESRKTIKGQVHGGGPMLSVRTGSGDIHIE